MLVVSRKKESILGADAKKESNMPQIGGFECLDLCLYGIRELAEQHILNLWLQVVQSARDSLVLRAENLSDCLSMPA